MSFRTLRLPAQRWGLVGCALIGLNLSAVADEALHSSTFNAKQESFGARPQAKTAYGTFGLGKKPYPSGTREKWIAEGRVMGRAPDAALWRKKTLKETVNNTNYMPPIGNQGSEGSCVHWAGSYYVKTAAMKQQQPTLDVNLSSNQCSPRFTYNFTNSGTDSGGYGHEPFEMFQRYGAASLAQMPYVAGQFRFIPRFPAFLEGLHRRSTNYVWLWQWQPDAEQVLELKQYLAAGGVASCAVYAETTFQNWTPEQGYWRGAACNANMLNHMVTVCGYGKGYYLVANSWGTDFGSNGYIYVEEDYFTNYVGDILFPLEGSYAPVTSYAKVGIEHTYRSDLRPLAIFVNSVNVWSNAPLPRSLPLEYGEDHTDPRPGLEVAVDVSSAAWNPGVNTVVVWCADAWVGDIGSFTNVSVWLDGQAFHAQGLPAAIPDNDPAGVAVQVVVTRIPTNRSGPLWWYRRGVVSLGDDVMVNDYAAANAGQLKWIATNAFAAIQASYGTENDVAAGDKPSAAQVIAALSPTNHYVLVNVGQVKYLAEPFWRWLIAEGVTNRYPWTTNTVLDDVNDSAATIGQVKEAFGFDVP